MNLIKKNLVFLIVFLSINEYIGAQPSKSFQNFVVEKLNETNFSSNAEKVARSVAGNFLKLYESDKFKEAFLFDEVQQQYSINKDLLPYNLQTIDWEGIDKEAKPNAFGKYTSTDYKVYNTLLATWLCYYMKEYPPLSQNTINSVLNTRFPMKYAFGEIFEFFVSRHYFHGNMKLCVSKWIEINNIPDRTTKLLYYLKANCDSYLQNYEQNKNIDHFENIPEVINLSNALKTNNLEEIESAFNKLGFSINSYLYMK